MKKPEEFNLVKILNQKRKDEKLTYEGAIVAFKLPDGQTGTWTLAEDLGIRLRLIQEGKIQDKVMDFAVEEMARKTFISPFTKQPEVKKEVTYAN